MKLIFANQTIASPTAFQFLPMGMALYSNESHHELLLKKSKVILYPGLRLGGEGIRPSPRLALAPRF